MRIRNDPAQATGLVSQPGAGPLPSTAVLTELFLSGFRRDLRQFLPGVVLETVPERATPVDGAAAPILGSSVFRWLGPDADEHDPEVVLFQNRYRLVAPAGRWLSPQDRRLAAAIGSVLDLRFHLLFHVNGLARLDLYRSGSEDHYIAAFIEPDAYTPRADRASRIALTLQTLRTAALTTYENHRVTTGALLVGPGARPDRPTPPDALNYGTDLPRLKSMHRLCDGERTLFLVDRDGRLADVIAIDRWAERCCPPRVPGPSMYAPHARATAEGGHVCLTLSRNQEIKVFAEGTQVFSFAHGRWRMLDPERKFAAWKSVIRNPELATALFQAAVNLAEDRRGALFVVLDDPALALGRLIASHDLLDAPVDEAADANSPDASLRRSLHYLARGRQVQHLDPEVLEALASLDGALVVDRTGRLVAFGAILRHVTPGLPSLAHAEGARTTAALVASTFGPALKVSEDGIITSYLDGARAWDL
ncbi:MAG: hypothetical protein U0800_18095 [Isosphaeraceae bacterium]